MKDKDDRKADIVFLGGTCNESTWRSELIPLLEKNHIPYFNPVVKDWTPEHIAIEDWVKSHPSTIELYVITADMIGCYSVAEAVDASNKKPDRTILSIVKGGFGEREYRSLSAVKEMVKFNNAYIANSFKEIIDSIEDIYRNREKA